MARARVSEKVRQIEETAQENESNIGGFVTVGDGIADIVIIPLTYVAAAGFASGFRGAWTKGGKKKQHERSWINKFYKQPSGTEEQSNELYYGRIAADMSSSVNEFLGSIPGALSASVYGVSREGYRALKTRSDKGYQVDAKEIGKNKN